MSSNFKGFFHHRSQMV